MAAIERFEGVADCARTYDEGVRRNESLYDMAGEARATIRGFIKYLRECGRK